MAGEVDPGMRAVRLTAPDGARVAAPVARGRMDAQQEQALEALEAGRSAIVHAPPGAGRTALVLTALTQGAAGSEPFALVPRRTSASALQDALALAGDSRARVMTPPALAFSILRAAAVRDGRGEPSLVTGAEQDALLAELIRARTQWELEIDPAARALPGFRDELRDLVTRAGQLGLGPDQLAELGARSGRAAWADAAAVLRDYLGVLDLESAAALDSGSRLDSGALVRRAADLLEREPEAIALPSAVVVDDAQDLTPAAIALVAALGQAGSPLLVTSCPELAVETFRGARPEAAATLAASLPEAPVQVLLEERRVGTPGLQRAADALRGRLPLAGSPAAARRPAPAASGQDGVGEDGTGESGMVLLRASDDLEEARLIASALREARHRLGVAYDDMAVVCRSGAAVELLADQLARAGLPVRTPRRLGPLPQEPVVADLLTIVDIALALESAGGSSAEIDRIIPGPLATRLLTGPFGDADPLRLLRIRRRLLDAHRERAHIAAQESGQRAAEGADPGDGQPEPIESEQLLARALALAPEALAAAGLETAVEEIRGRAAAPVQRVRAMIAAARASAAAGAEATLWAAWDAAGLAAGWQRAVLESRTDAEAARGRMLVRRLDALMALFASAERFTERRPDADAAALVEHVRSQAVAEDTLAPVSAARGRVDVMTPAQLAGEHRDTVVLARVQEGAWPDLRLRSTLFGAADLAPMLEHAAGPAPDREALRAQQRQSVLADELRLAVSALSRARRRVLVTAVDGGDQTPSALFHVLEAATGDDPDWIDPDALRTDPGPAPDARRLVAALRSRLHSRDPREAVRAAELLVELEEAGADGTDPRTWYHQEPTSSEPMRQPDSPLVLSPSALELAEQCPRAWLLERSGGQASGGAPQLIGTALHALAELHPQGSAEPDGVEDLLSQMHRMLRPMGLERTWSGRQRLERATEAVRVMDAHLRTAPRALAVEAPFEVEIGPVRLRGKIDRIEGDETGLHVSDLKTGRSAKTQAKAEDDLQLAAYQAAVREGALAEALGADAPQRLNGARLIYVGTGTKSASIRTQGALTRAENRAWFDDLVVRVAEEVSGVVVEARRCEHCDLCSVRSSCPLQDEGAQL